MGYHRRSLSLFLPWWTACKAGDPSGALMTVPMAPALEALMRVSVAAARKAVTASTAFTTVTVTAPDRIIRLVITTRKVRRTYFARRSPLRPRSPLSPWRRLQEISCQLRYICFSLGAKLTSQVGRRFVHARHCLRDGDALAQGAHGFDHAHRYLHDACARGAHENLRDGACSKHELQ